MTIGTSFDAASEFFGSALGPLAGSTDSPEAAAGLMEIVGWTDLPSIPDALLDLQQSLEGLLDAQVELIQARIALSDETGDADAVGDALSAVTAQLGLLVTDIHRLPDAFRQELPEDYRTATGIVEQVEKRLFDALIYTAIEEQFPTLRRVLSLLGILEQERREADAAKHQPPFVLLQVRWDRLPTLLHGPEAVLREVYGWGTPSLNTEKFFEVLLDLSFGFLSPAEIRYPSDVFLNAIAPGGLVSPTDGREPMLMVPLAAVGGLGLDLGFLAAPKQMPDEIQGLGVHLVGVGSLTESLRIGAGLFFDLHADVDLVAGAGAIIRPNEGIALVTNPDSTPVAFAGGKITGRVSRRLESGEDPINLVTIAGGAFIDAQELFVEAGVDATSSPPDLLAEVGINAGRFVIPSGGTDSFTRSLLPGEGIVVNFDVGLGWSQRRGVFLRASAGLETVIPINATLGPFRVDLVRLRILANDDGLALSAGVVGSATLGPVTVIVDAIGIQADVGLDFGNVGPIDLDLGLSIPRGYGILVDAGAVRGGGFLFFGDQQYSGVIELSVFGFSVKAFGLIDTVLPDGSDGFSFVIIIVAEFTPIQLGFGFTLLGVGGLVGIHRTLDERGLGDAVRTGSLEHVLFARNPVQDAPAIIHDLTTVFPAAKGHYVFGPMAKFGWGTPTLISADVGIVLEFPGPRLAVLGVARMQLPSAEFALLSLQLALSGLLDFPAKTFSLDAGLYDSNVVGFPVTGNAAYRLGFGNNAKFLLSIGGFNPSFDAPASFPELRRAAVDLGVNGNPSLVASGYFALTSNTAQIGAKLELRASGFGIRLHGYLGFDALFVFSPFSFTADFSAGMRVSFHGAGIGVTLRGSLSGPSPWKLRGKVCVSILFWDACLSVDHTFGRNHPAALKEMDPWDGTPDGTDARVAVIGLADAIADPRNWSGSNPPAGFAVVSLAAAATAGTTPIDPLGAATLRQKVVPLETQIDKFGEYRPITHDRFIRSSVTINDQPVSSVEPVTDNFAPAKFFDFSDAEKLSMDSYVPMEAGFAINANGVAIGSEGHKVLEYETAFITGEGQRVTDPNVHRLTQLQLVGLLKRSAAALGGIRRAGTQKYAVPTKKVTFGPKRFIVVDSCTSQRNNAIVTGTGVSQIQAFVALRNHVASNPADRGKYSIAPSYAAI